MRRKAKNHLHCPPEDVISLQSKSSRDVPTPSTANINDEMGSAKYSNQIEIYSEEVGNGTIKSDGGGSDIEVVGPPLPPRLPMRPSRITENGMEITWTAKTRTTIIRWGKCFRSSDNTLGGHARYAVLFISL